MAAASHPPLPVASTERFLWSLGNFLSVAPQPPESPTLQCAPDLLYNRMIVDLGLMSAWQASIWRSRGEMLLQPSPGISGDRIPTPLVFL